MHGGELETQLYLALEKFPGQINFSAVEIKTLKLFGKVEGRGFKSRRK